MFTILHISDLHRSPDDPIENESLIGALLTDRDNYLIESPQVRTPDAAIVSGDIIHGASLNDPNYEQKIKKQYEVAHDFLSQLAERFFDGNRSKIVIVPGNHDVCWNKAKQSMIELNTQEIPSKIGPSLFKADSKYRWCWSSRKVYRVENEALYNSRLDAYWNFIENFYAGVDLPHPIVRNRGYNLFELDNGRIVVAALESLHGNDCFCYQGSIERRVLSQCNLYIRDLKTTPILKVATWHHSFQGPPDRDDYMDASLVQEMVGGGFRLGFHGHQHQADASAYSVYLPNQYSMAISSTGSLCAGSKELPKGTNREYNIVVISDDYKSASIHVREMLQGNHFGKSGRGMFRMDGYVKLTWDLPALVSKSGESAQKSFDNQLIIQAESAFKSSEFSTAISILESLAKPIPNYAKKLLIDSAKEAYRWDLIISTIKPPYSLDDCVALFTAYMETNEFNLAADLLNSPEAKISESLKKDLFEQLTVKKLLKGKS